jgi:hypothetical protein
MRFMMLMIPKGYEAAGPGTTPDAEHVAEMMEYRDGRTVCGIERSGGRLLDDSGQVAAGGPRLGVALPGAR